MQKMVRCRYLLPPHRWISLVGLIMVKVTALQSRFTTSQQSSSRHPYPLTITKRMEQTIQGSNAASSLLSSSSELFRETPASNTRSFTDGVKLSNSNVILPWIGYGTYKLGKQQARGCTLEALKQGYRCLDTAFIYGGETTETQVGLALQDAITDKGIGITRRDEVVVITKHWRKYHGYESTLQCLNLSLKRLQLDYVDIYLMHWPGPAWNTMARRKDEIKQHGPWYYASQSEEDMPYLRGETWRAMEDAVKAGKVKAIGVSNFTIQHLKRLKETATIWPPAVNQIECHPLYPQTELVDYCQREGIVVQAYASLGGQDSGKTFWNKLYPKQPKKKGTAAAAASVEVVTKLWNAPPVMKLAKETNKTPPQILLRWALEKNIALVPKTATTERMVENSQVFDFKLSSEQITTLEKELWQAVEKASIDREEDEDPKTMGRLCWRNDPLRLLDFN